MTFLNFAGLKRAALSAASLLFDNTAGIKHGTLAASPQKTAQLDCIFHSIPLGSGEYNGEKLIASTTTVVARQHISGSMQAHT